MKTLQEGNSRRKVANKWPGLINDAIKLSEKLGIQGLLNNTVTKPAFKRMIKTQIKAMNDDELKEDLQKYKKMEIYMNSDLF